MSEEESHNNHISERTMKNKQSSVAPQDEQHSHSSGGNEAKPEGDSTAQRETDTNDESDADTEDDESDVSTVWMVRNNFIVNFRISLFVLFQI